MKRIVSFIMCFVLFIATASVVSATGENNAFEYEIDNVEYTVEFEDNTISPDTMQIIAENLVGLRDSSAQTYGLGCTLFGHDYVTKTAYVTEHKVATTAPRCLKHTYNVKYCEDCDYVKEQTLVASTYIDCCAAD